MRFVVLSFVLVFTVILPGSVRMSAVRLHHESMRRLADHGIQFLFGRFDQPGHEKAGKPVCVDDGISVKSDHPVNWYF